MHGCVCLIANLQPEQAEQARARSIVASNAIVLEYVPRLPAGPGASTSAQLDKDRSLPLVGGMLGTKEDEKRPIPERDEEMGSRTTGKTAIRPPGPPTVQSHQKQQQKTAFAHGYRAQFFYQYLEALP